MRQPHLLASIVACTIAAPAFAQADIVKLTRGKPIVARVWEKESDPVTFNVYRTAIRKVTHGTQTLPAKAVKQVIDDPDPHRSFWRAAQMLGPGTAEEWFLLGQAAIKNKVRGLARHAFLEALICDPEHTNALRRLDAAGKKSRIADPRSNPRVREELAAYLAATTGVERKAVFGKLQKLGSKLPTHYLDRVRRSAKEKKGRTDDRLLTFRADEWKGVYTLFVPKSYDPMVATPMVVALHGGGRGGKDGKAVVGSGKSAMNFYARAAQRRGWIVVCPTALAAPWRQRHNEGLLLAVVEEMTMLFNIDRNRIYLTGHSMGGYGTWHFGPKLAHLWAAIAPMAGGGGSGLKRLRDTFTGVYLYHGADDNVVGVGSDRAIAERMHADSMDFVYAEIPDSGHGFPAEVQAEMWEFFALRRLAIAPKRRAEGKFKITEDTASSFLDKPGKEEIAWFGPLGVDAGDSEGADLSTLLKALRRGGGLARSASQQLATLGGSGVGAKVAAVMLSRSSTADSRRFAAEALGGIGDPSTAKALHKALADLDLSVVAAAALALGSVPHSDTPKRYAACLTDLARRYADCMTGGAIDFPDFTAHLQTVTRLVEGATNLADPACGKVIAQAASEFLLPDQDVHYSKRTGNNPAVPRRQLARAVIAGCRACPGDATRPTLEALSERTDLRVADDARSLLGK